MRTAQVLSGPMARKNEDVTGFRLTKEVIERVEAYAARRTAETGIPVSRSHAVRELLARALDADEAERKATKKGKAR